MMCCRINKERVFKVTLLLAGLFWLSSASLAQAKGGGALETNWSALRPMTTIGKAFNNDSGSYLLNSGNAAASHRVVTEWHEQYGNLTMLRSGHDGLGYAYVINTPSVILFSYPGFDDPIAA
jgi:hypothetical protein